MTVRALRAFHARAALSGLTWLAFAAAPAHAGDPRAAIPGGPLGLASAEPEPEPLKGPALMRKLVEDLQSPLMNDRLAAIVEIGKQREGPLLQQFNILNLLRDIAADPYEFDRLRSETLRTLMILRDNDIGLADLPTLLLGLVHPTVQTAVNANPAQKETRRQSYNMQVGLDALSLLHQMVRSGDLGQNIALRRSIYDGLHKVWDYRVKCDKDDVLIPPPGLLVRVLATMGVVADLPGNAANAAFVKQVVLPHFRNPIKVEADHTLVPGLLAGLATFYARVEPGKTYYDVDAVRALADLAARYATPEVPIRPDPSWTRVNPPLVPPENLPPALQLEVRLGVMDVLSVMVAKNPLLFADARNAPHSAEIARLLGHLRSAMFGNKTRFVHAVGNATQADLAAPARFAAAMRELAKSPDAADARGLVGLTPAVFAAHGDRTPMRTQFVEYRSWIGALQTTNDDLEIRGLAGVLKWVVNRELVDALLERIDPPQRLMEQRRERAALTALQGADRPNALAVERQTVKINLLDLWLDTFGPPAGEDDAYKLHPETRKLVVDVLFASLRQLRPAYRTARNNAARTTSSTAPENELREIESLIERIAFFFCRPLLRPAATDADDVADRLAAVQSLGFWPREFDTKRIISTLLTQLLPRDGDPRLRLEAEQSLLYLTDQQFRQYNPESLQYDGDIESSAWLRWWIGDLVRQMAGTAPGDAARATILSILRQYTGLDTAAVTATTAAPQRTALDPEAAVWTAWNATFNEADAIHGLLRDLIDAATTAAPGAPRIQYLTQSLAYWTGQRFATADGAVDVTAWIDWWIKDAVRRLANATNEEERRLLDALLRLEPQGPPQPGMAPNARSLFAVLYNNGRRTALWPTLPMMPPAPPDRGRIDAAAWRVWLTQYVAARPR